MTETKLRNYRSKFKQYNSLADEQIIQGIKLANPIYSKLSDDQIIYGLEKNYAPASVSLETAKRFGSDILSGITKNVGEGAKDIDLLIGKLQDYDIFNRKKYKFLQETKRPEWADRPFKKIAEVEKEASEFYSKYGIKPIDKTDIFLKKLATATGQTGADIAKILATPGKLPVYSALTATAKGIEEKKTGIELAKETGKGLASGLVFHYIFKALGYLPRGIREPVGGFIFGYPRYKEEKFKTPEKDLYIGLHPKLKVRELKIDPKVNAYLEYKTGKSLYDIPNFEQIYDGLQIKSLQKELEYVTEKRDYTDAMVDFITGGVLTGIGKKADIEKIKSFFSGKKSNPLKDKFRQAVEFSEEFVKKPKPTQQDIKDIEFVTEEFSKELNKFLDQHPDIKGFLPSAKPVEPTSPKTVVKPSIQKFNTIDELNDWFTKLPEGEQKVNTDSYQSNFDRIINEQNQLLRDTVEKETVLAEESIKKPSKSKEQPSSIIQLIKASGGIKPTKKYDNLPLAILRKDGYDIAEMADLLEKEDYLQVPSNKNAVDVLYEKIIAKEKYEQIKPEKTSAEQQKVIHEASLQQAKTIFYEDLKRGDSFTIGGEKYDVIQKDKNKALVQDGKTYELEPGFSPLDIDEGSFKHLGKIAKAPESEKAIELTEAQARKLYNEEQEILKKLPGNIGKAKSEGKLPKQQLALVEHLEEIEKEMPYNHPIRIKLQKETREEYDVKLAEWRDKNREEARKKVADAGFKEGDIVEVFMPSFLPGVPGTKYRGVVKIGVNSDVFVSAKSHPKAKTERLDLFSNKWRKVEGEQPRPEIKIKDPEVTASYKGQINLIIRAIDKNGKQVGKLEYAQFNGKPKVSFIEVTPENRRKGIATKLFKKLQAEYPDQKIDIGYSTEEGAEFIKSLEKEINPISKELVKPQIKIEKTAAGDQYSFKPAAELPKGKIKLTPGQKRLERQEGGLFEIEKPKGKQEGLFEKKPEKKLEKPIEVEFQKRIERIITEAKESGKDLRVKLQTELNKISNSFRSQAASKTRELNPFGRQSEMGVVLGIAAPKGKTIRSIHGIDYIFKEKDTPTKEQIYEIEDLYKNAEEYTKKAIEYGFGIIGPNRTIGNKKVLENGLKLKKQGLLDKDEIAFVDKLEKFWKAHPNAESGTVISDGSIREFGIRGRQPTKKLVKPEELLATKPSGKEPWEMTKDEYRESQRKGSEVLPLSVGKFHKSSVKQAIEHGEIIPEEVLKDYPDLAKETAEVKPITEKKTPITDESVNKIKQMQTSKYADLFKFGDKIIHERQYFGFPTPYRWPGYKVKMNDGTELIVYNAKSGWVVVTKDGESFGKEKKGSGWIGFPTKEMAVDNYIETRTAKVFQYTKERYPYLEDNEIELLNQYKEGSEDFKIKNKEKVGNIYKEIDITERAEKEKFNNGQSIKDYYDKKIAQGYNRLEKSHNRTYLVNDKDGSKLLVSGTGKKYLEFKKDIELVSQEKLPEKRSISFYDKDQKERTGKLIRTDKGDYVIDYQGKQLTVKPENIKTVKGIKDVSKIEETEVSYGSNKIAEQTINELVTQIENKYDQRLPDVRRQVGGIQPISETLKELKRNKVVNYYGKKIKSREDIINIAEIYRSPKIEHFQIFYLNNDNILLAHNVISSGVIDYVHFTLAMKYKIINAAKRLGASNVYFVHNHPSEDHTPSKADLYFTVDMDNLLFKNGIDLKKHIVIDDKKFSEIWVINGNAKFVEITYNKEKPRLHETISPPLTESDEIVAFVKQRLVNNQSLAVVYLDGRLKVISLDLHDIEILNKETFKETIKQHLKKYGATVYVIVDNSGIVNADKLDKLPYAFPQGLLEFIVSKKEFTLNFDPFEMNIEQPKFKKSYFISQSEEKYRKKSKETEFKLDDFEQDPTGFIRQPSINYKKKALQAIEDYYKTDDIKKTTKAIIRRAQGPVELNTDRIYEANKKNFRAWDKLLKQPGKKFIIDFIDLIETGNVRTIEKKYGKGFYDLSQYYRLRLDKNHELTEADFSAFIENYFPHIWKKPVDAHKFFSTYIKKFGKPGFSKQRNIPLFKAGVDYGLEPSSWNPEEIVQFREKAAFQWLATKQIKEDLKTNGLLKFFKHERDLEHGYKKLDHSAFDVYQFSEIEKGYIKRGFWAAPEDAAKVINNWLSPSLWSRQDKRGKIFQAAMRTKNIFVPLKLGLSGWHAFEVTFSSIANQATIAMQAYQKGIAKGLYETSIVPFAPFFDLFKGHKIRKAWYKGATPGSFEALAVEYMSRANMVPGITKKYLMDAKYQMRRAFDQGKYFKASLKLPLALIEGTMYPILELYVPRIKMAAFSHVAETKILNMQLKNPAVSKIEIDKTLIEIGDQMANAFGQVNYDNLFWNRTVRDLLVAASLSLGWGLGTVRWMGGSVLDIGKMALALTSGRKPIVTQRMLYALIYPIVFGTIGAILHYLMTGEKPKEIKDYYYPKTGAKNTDGSDERLQMATQMKEPFAMEEAIRKEGIIKGPATVAMHKISPPWPTFVELIENKDYYGIKISDAPFGTEQWGIDLANFIYEALEPISISARSRFQREGIKNIGFLGLSPAPRYITRTITQKNIFDAVANEWGQKTKSKFEGEQYEIRSDVRSKIKKNILTTKELINAIEKGAIKPKGLGKFYMYSEFDGDIRAFSMLSSKTQSELMTNMNMDEIKRYVWFAHTETKLNFVLWLEKNKGKRR